MDDLKRYLDFFGLDSKVSEKELKAVRNLYLKTYHPDSGRPDSEEMAKMTNIAYEKISVYIRYRDQAAPKPAPAAGLDLSSRPEDARPRDAYYQKKATEFLRKRSRGKGDQSSMFQPRQDDIYGEAMSRTCKKYFVDAVINYTYEKSVVRDLNYTCGWYLNVFPIRVLVSWVYEVYPDWDGNRRDIRALIRKEDYRKLFVFAVNEYVREKRCTIKEALLAFRIPASKYYHWKSGIRDDLLKP
jgi:hypothetical protein